MGAQHIIAQVEGNEYSSAFSNDGRFIFGEESPRDLFFATERKEGQTPVYHEPTGKIRFGNAYSTKKEAEEASKYDVRYLTTAKVEWEE